MTLREKTLLAIAEVHSGNGAEGERIADAAILALRQWMDAEGLVCVPKTITAEMAWCLENNFAEPLPASQLHANNWQDAYTAMIAAAPDVLGEK